MELNLDKYYLVKRSVAEVDPTLAPLCKFEQESLSLAKVIGESDFYKIYLVRTPFRFEESGSVEWITNIVTGPKDNFDREFLPLSDVLAGAFETNEEVGKLQFSHYNNLYNIGFGTPKAKNGEGVKTFFDLGINQPSLKVNKNNTLQHENVLWTLEISNIRNENYFVKQIERYKQELEQKLAKRTVKTRAIAAYTKQYAKIKLLSMLPSALIATKFKQEINQIVEEGSWHYFIDRLNEKLTNKLDLIFMEKNYTLLSGEKFENLAKLTHNEKKHLFFSFLKFGEKVAHEEQLYTDEQIAKYNHESDLILDEYVAGIEALKNTLEVSLKSQKWAKEQKQKANEELAYK